MTDFEIEENRVVIEFNDNGDEICRRVLKPGELVALNSKRQVYSMQTKIIQRRYKSDGSYTLFTIDNLNNTMTITEYPSPQISLFNFP